MTALNPVMRIGEQVGETLLVHGLADRRAAAAAAVEALRKVGIPAPEAVARRWPHELSGGMRQRAMIAAAMIAKPRLLIADEPTTALDVTIEAQILDLLRDLRRSEGAAILLITHDLGVVAEVADRVVVLYAGQVVEDSPVADLFARPLHPYAEGLLASMPRPGRQNRRLPAIPGIVPRPHERPIGCRFAPRCPYRIDACGDAIVLREIEPGRQVRCIRAGEVAGGFAVGDA
jgi:oligopeptide/dipeptide ABC transporter ATP-binding protein